ncbi:MAG TPA: hypothetical protein P5322_12785, partial [Spirochaetota bacterium]|nr:hypothetical protein [Spirochaetota bacterium]
QPLYNRVIRYKDSIPLSAHSPVFSKHFLNLAMDDAALIRDTFNEAKKHLEFIGDKLFFFHGFFMANEPIVMDMNNYRKVIRKGVGEDLCYKGSFIMNPELFDTDIFNRYKETFLRNYKMLKEENKDFIISLENDFVGIGSGLQRPREILELIENLYFDIGHFWTSSLLHKFDYYEAASEIIQKKNITGCHIQRSLIGKSVPLEKIYDTHSHIYLESEQDVQKIVRMLANKGIEKFTLEIIDGDLKDIETFIDYIS